MARAERLFGIDMGTHSACGVGVRILARIKGPATIEKILAPECERAGTQRLPASAGPRPPQRGSFEETGHRQANPVRAVPSAGRLDDTISTTTPLARVRAPNGVPLPLLY
jgi:hypothetical protein